MARRGIHAVIDDAIHQVFLVSDPLSLPTQTFLQDIVLRNVQSLVVLCIHDVPRTILHQFDASSSVTRLKFVGSYVFTGM